MAKKTVENLARIQRALSQSHLNKELLKKQKEAAMKRGILIKLEAVKKRHNDFEDLKLNFFSHLWISVIKFCMVLKTVKMRIFLTKKLKFIQIQTHNRTVLIQKGFKRFMKSLPETPD